MSTKESASTEQSGDEVRKMTAMNAWLDEVCAELGVDRDLVRASTPAMLRLVGQVAHGPSRPGAPLTALVVGLAAAGAVRETGAAGDGGAAAVRQQVDTVAALVDRWAERQA